MDAAETKDGARIQPAYGADASALRASAPLNGRLGIRMVKSSIYQEFLIMRLNHLVVLFFVGFNTCEATAETSIFTDMSTRSACVEHLKGLGSASVIFDAPINAANLANRAANDAMIWDAQLITESGQIVRVQLHCATINSPLQQDTRNVGAPQSLVSELVRH